MEYLEIQQSDHSIFKNFSPEEKIEVLFKKNYKPLCKSLHNILRDVAVAEDIVQEVFLKVWDRRDNLKLDEGIQSYLYRACYNSALNFLKSQKRFSDIDTTALNHPGYESAEDNLHYSETEKMIIEGIEALPTKTRLVFSLSRFEDLTYKEIAERLEVSVKAVEKHMGIALFRLRDNLKEVLVIFIVTLISIFF